MRDKSFSPYINGNTKHYCKVKRQYPKPCSSAVLCQPAEGVFTLERCVKCGKSE